MENVRLTASTSTDRTPLSPFEIRLNVTYRSAIVFHRAEVEKDLLSTYETRLLASYLANIASALKRQDLEARGLIDWIADRDNRMTLGARRRRRRRHLKLALEKQKISTKTLRHLEEALQNECPNIPARLDRIVLRLRRRSNTGRLYRTDLDIIELRLHS